MFFDLQRFSVYKVMKNTNASLESVVSDSVFHCLISDKSVQVYNRNFEGATDISNGKNGMVPAPTVNDKDKFLKGDGTWMSVSGSDDDEYVLPTASSSVKGGIRVGTGLSMNGETLNCTVSSPSVMTAATSSSPGKSGLVPAPAAGEQGSFLRGDGIWVVPADISVTYEEATTTKSGLMSAADKKKLDEITTGTGTSTYTLPTASTTTKGGIKVGTGLSMNGETLNCTISTSGTGSVFTATSNGLVPSPSSANTSKFLRGDGTWVIPPDTNTTYSVATTTTSGLMSAADKKKLDGIAASANEYTLPTASTSTKGGVKIGTGLSMNGETLNCTVSSGATYSVANSSTDGLLSAAMYDKLQSVFRNSSNLADTVIAGVGGKLIPSANSVQDILKYPGAFNQLDNKVAKVLARSDYAVYEESEVSLYGGNAHVYFNHDGLKHSLVSAMNGTIQGVKLSADTSTRDYTYGIVKLTDTGGFITRTGYVSTSSTDYDGSVYVQPFIVSATGKLSLGTNTSIKASESSVARWGAVTMSRSIFDPTNIMFYVDSDSTANNTKYNYLTVSFQGYGTGLTRIQASTVMGTWHSVAYANITDFVCDQLGRNSAGLLNWSFDAETGKITIKGLNNYGRDRYLNELPFIAYTLRKYNASGDNTRNQSFIIINHGLKQGVPISYKYYDDYSDGIDLPWLDKKTAYAGIWRSRTNPGVCYMVCFETGTFDYSADWWSAHSKIYSFDFKTPGIILTSYKLAHIIDDLLL